MPEELFNELKNKYESGLKDDFNVVLKNRRTMGFALGGFFGAILLMMFGGFFGILSGNGIVFTIGPIIAIGSFIVMIVQMFKGNKGEGAYHTKYYETVVKDLISTMYSDVNLSLTDLYDFRNVGNNRNKR